MMVVYKLFILTVHSILVRVTVPILGVFVVRQGSTLHANPITNTITSIFSFLLNRFITKHFKIINNVI